jgi:WD40 repeat protein
MPLKTRNARNGRDIVHFPGHQTIVFCTAWQGERIAAAGANGAVFTVKVWDTKTQREVFSIPESPNGIEFLAVTFSPDGRYLATGGREGKLQVWNAESGQAVGTHGTHDREIRGVVFNADGSQIASASGDGRVKVWAWDAAHLGQLQEPVFQCQARVPGVYLNVAFSPDRQHLVTGGEGYTARVWDMESGQEVQTLRGHTGEICTVAFSDAGQWLATAGEDTTIKIWNATSWKLQRTLRGHTGLVSRLAFTSASQRLVSGSRDHTIRVWDATGWEETPDH